jgi:hypothetical protein
MQSGPLVNLRKVEKSMSTATLAAPEVEVNPEIIRYLAGCSDLEQLKAIRKAIYKRVEAVQAASQKVKEDEAWKSIRNVRAGDRIYPWTRIQRMSLPDMKTILLVEPGDYLLVDYIPPRAHWLWLAKKNCPIGLRGKQRREAEQRKDLVFFNAFHVLSYNLHAQPPAEQEGAPGARVIGGSDADRTA